MDPQRFDSLARSLAAPKTRRGFLGTMAALAAGLTGSRAVGAQVSQAQCGNKVCAANPGGCTDGCVCCVYGNGNSRCRPSGDCTGTIATPTTTTAPPCSPQNGPCTVSDDCCGDGFCFQQRCVVVPPSTEPTPI